MKLWHTDMIKILPRLQLLESHRELCALRGKAWGRKHSMINYIFHHSWEYLYHYHKLVMTEMKARGYKPNPIWNDFYYRGKRLPPIDPEWVTRTHRQSTYPEHNRAYKIQCTKNLMGKLKSADPKKYNETEVYRFYSWVQENNLPIE